jgi:class 3 adenylate cyclase
MTGAAPSGVVTFLFTDVEGSTRRWEADADEMRAALAAHDQVLRKAIEAHRGWLFKHSGDGICAAFASTSRRLILKSVHFDRLRCTLAPRGRLCDLEVNSRRGRVRPLLGAPRRSAD